MHPVYGILKAFRNPARAALVVAGLLWFLVVMLGGVLALLVFASAEEFKAPNYSSGGLIVVGAMTLVMAGFAVALPWVMAKSVRRLDDSPHSIEAFAGSLFVFATVCGMACGMWGFIAAIMFSDARVFLPLALLGFVATLRSWPTLKRLRALETQWRAAGVLVVEPDSGGQAQAR